MTPQQRQARSDRLATLALLGGLAIFVAGAVLDAPAVLIVGAAWSFVLVLAAAAGRGPVA